MTPDQSTEEPLNARTAALVDLARRSLGTLSDAHRATGLAGLRGAMSSRRRAHETRRIHTVAAAALFAAAAVAGMVLRRDRHTAISFRIDGGELRPDGYVEAGSSARPVLHFSDGSEVSLASLARVHVHAIDEHGARVTLDEGQAHVYVVHSPETRWVFDAGPFVVAVTGTAFGISWAADEHRLDVRLENGSVTVSGPVSDAPLALRAGQWLTVRANDVLIRGLGAVDGALAAVPAASGTEPAAPVAEESAPSIAIVETSGAIGPPAKGGPTRRDASNRMLHARMDEHAAEHAWTADLAAGRFDAIVDDATRMGLDNAFSVSSNDELAALGDAARYTRHVDVARGALLAQRRRFPSTFHARVAAFSLGRLSETEGDARAALFWFESYLGESPDGTFASEALGRKMTIVQRLDGKDSARPLAEIYLRRFPTGTYAQAARALTLRP